MRFKSVAAEMRHAETAMTPELVDRVAAWLTASAGMGPEDFSLRETDLDEALDLFAVCRRA